MRGRRLCCFVYGTLSVGLAGCTLNAVGQLLPASDKFPSEVAFVSANAADFGQSPDSPLADVTPGEVFDSLVALDGCWGSAGVFARSEGEADLEVFEAYRVDVAAGTVNWQIVQAESSASVARDTTVIDAQATFSLIEDGSGVVVDVDTVTLLDSDSGELTTVDYDPDGPLGDVVASGEEVKISVSGDNCRLANRILNDGFSEQRVELQFKRFTCP